MSAATTAQIATMCDEPRPPTPTPSTNQGPSSRIRTRSPPHARRTQAAALDLAYCVVADESVGRQVPLAFLERVKDDFVSKYGAGKAATAAANSLNKEFGSKLKEHMQYCVDHPEEISKLAKVKAQVSEVKGVMMENIEKVLDRGEKIELLVDKTENLHQQAQDFRTAGTKIRRKMWLQNMKIKLIVLGILIALILIIVLSVCHGFNCGK
ncbi:hypothetical protein TIFTF001_029349 [Ficus carica]|uniref:Uncharacterized protein n=1 Tax=Ficus carica TaxID=3494 RepID=A0AA88DRN4_FICCA|nr:hypothetical protein TIFTF001_029349 [Ficus carica]